MSLEAIRVANFKAFGATQRVPLRPITLLYGANSAGKSSVIHALALTHEALETGTLDVHRTGVGGDSIDLGGFAQYVHRRDRERLVTLAFELGDVGVLPHPEDEDEHLVTLPQALLEIRIGTSAHAGTNQLGEENRSRVRLERWALEVNGTPLLSLSARRDGFMTLSQLDVTHPSLLRVLANYLALPDTAKEIRDCDPGNLSSVWASLPEIQVYPSGLRPSVWPFHSHSALPQGGTAARHLELARTALSGVLKALIDGITKVLAEDLGDMPYLGPLRSVPPRHPAPPSEQDPNRHSGGAYAWGILRSNRAIRQRVNDWLGDPDRLKTPYELKVRHLLPSDLLQSELANELGPKLYELGFYLLEQAGRSEHSPELASALELVRQNADQESDAAAEAFMAVGDVVDAIFDAGVVADEWVRKMAEAHGGDALEDLVLVDKRSSILVSPRDVGVGVSQVLPVLVSAYGEDEALVAIEQPEIHLHPALQAELGDVFLESALGGRNNRFLIETHSEHLLLRIMRRMRQTFDGEPLPNELPPVRPEDVAVLFVEPDGSQSLVREMPLNERGDLVKAWPGGFFDEAMGEIF